MKNTSIIERIEYAAQNGVYEIPLYVWNKTAKKLRKDFMKDFSYLLMLS